MAISERGTAIGEPYRTLLERGFLVVDLDDPAVVFETRDWLIAALRDLGLPRLDRLERYHEHVPADDARHFSLLHALATRYWRAGFGRRIAERNRALLHSLVGLDVHVQKYPYLRVARPAVAGDTTGLHRDLYYGASPYEISLFVPLVDLSAESALRVIPGSHREPDSAYPFTQERSPDVTPGSAKHELGFPYAPRRLDPALEQRSQPVPMAVGQVLVFGLALVHGQTINRSATTRFSTDVRAVSSLAPVRFERGVRADYYEPLCSSPASELARAYPSGSARNHEA
jgi:phytanoyl-CoA dioxygenase PhyH